MIRREVHRGRSQGYESKVSGVPHRAGPVVEQLRSATWLRGGSSHSLALAPLGLYDSPAALPSPRCLKEIREAYCPSRPRFGPLRPRSIGGAAPWRLPTRHFRYLGVASVSFFCRFFGSFGTPRSTSYHWLLSFGPGTWSRWITRGYRLVLRPGALRAAAVAQSSESRPGRPL